MRVSFEIYGNHILVSSYSVEASEIGTIPLPNVGQLDTAADYLRKLAIAFNVWQEREISASHKATCAK